MATDMLRNCRTLSLHQNTSKLRAHCESEHLIEARPAHTTRGRATATTDTLWWLHSENEPVSDMETSTGTQKGQQDFELVK